jgi:hypothetical protein
MLVPDYLVPDYKAAPAPADEGPSGKTLKALPVITGLGGGACIKKGGRVTVAGRNFGQPFGKRLVLGGGAVYTDLVVMSWSDAAIVARVPGDARVKEGRSYSIGLRARTGQIWLGNHVTALICGATQSLSTDLGALQGAIGAGSAGSGGIGSQRLSVPPQQKGTGFVPGGTAGSQSGQRVPPPSGPGSGAGLSAGGTIALGPLPSPPAPASPPRDPDDVEPGEVMVAHDSAEAAATFASEAAALEFAVLRRHVLPDLGLVITIFEVPPGTTVTAALATLRQAFPDVLVDANHRYELQAAGPVSRRYGVDIIGWRHVTGECGANLRLGLIDTGVDLTHPALASQRIVAETFLRPGVPVASADHGTAVAAILVGSTSQPEFTGLLPGAQLFSAAIFKLVGLRGPVATAEGVLRGLAWMSGQGVKTVNMSFAGPRNQIMELAIKLILNRGLVAVAAAGNAGPTAPPAYPAAQEGVVAVTAVDAALALFTYANRGAYVDFAAPGVNVWSALPGGGGSFQTGTSFAAPFVTAILAQALSGPPERNPQEILANFAASARDLGTQGRDGMFGWGLIQSRDPCPRR